MFDYFFSFTLIHILILKLFRVAGGSARLTLIVVQTVLVLDSVVKILADPAVPTPNVTFA